MHKTLVFAFSLTAVLLAGCAQHALPLAQNSPAAAAKETARRAGATVCDLVRTTSGPPGPPPGMAQAGPPASAYRVVAHRWLARHCSTRSGSTARGAATASPVVTPPRPTVGFPRPAAFYPRAAQRLGEEGTVRLRICISPTGRVRAASIARSSGSRVLDQAAIRFAHSTTGHWVPATRGGIPVGECTALPVRFSLTNF